MMMPEAGNDEPAPSGGIDPTMNQATGARISDGEFRMVEDLDKAKPRACLRARQHLQKLESEWWAADQRRDNELKMRIYNDMNHHYPYLDCQAFPSQ